MDRGFYASVSAMMSGTKKINDVANNIANINTIGFKKDVSTIEEFSNIMNNKLNDRKNIGYMDNQVYVDDTFTIYRDGSITQTSQPLDFAISGEGFFKIEKDGNYLYTRDGSFSKDSNGYLVTSDGGFVLNKLGNRIVVEDGKNYSSDLMVVNFQNKQTLKKIALGYYTNSFGLSQETNVNNPSVRQGYLEMSNVDAAEELTDLIKFQRYYQFNQRSLQSHDELLEKIAQF